MATLEKYGASLRTHKSQLTASTYERAADQFLRWLIRRKLDVRTMHRGAVQDFSDYLAKRYKPRSVHTITCAVWHFLNWLRDQGVSVPEQSRPAKPRLDNIAHHFLTSEELRSCLKVLEGWENPSKTAIVMLAGTGLRVSELCNLKIGDIIVHSPGKLLLRVEGKGNKLRTVPVMAFVVPVLTDYMKGWLAKHGASGYLFPSEKTGYRKPLSARVVDYWCQSLSKEIGKRVFPHAFRHSYITLLHDSGVDDMSIALVVGHSDTSTTKRYTHPSFDKLLETSTKGERKLWQGAK